MHQKVRAVVFDLNGVFIQGPLLSDCFQKDFIIGPERFLPALKSTMDIIRLPGASHVYEYWEPYLKTWGVNLSKDQFVDYWFKTEKEVPEMIEIVETLKKNGTKVFILSNNFRERTDYYNAHFSSLKMFDGLYYSWQTGFVKPSAEAYRNILEKNQLAAADVVYFDDSEKNIEVARSLGIQAYIFVGPAQVKSVLNM